MKRFGVARHSARCLGVVWLLLSFLAVSSSAQLRFKEPASASEASALTAQVKIKVPTTGPELETVLSQGRKLETERRWSEAVSLYEEFSRKNPGESALEARLDLAKIHYDVGRRYADSTFRKNLATLSESEALDLYSQVTSRLYTHYVQPPDWKQLFDRGTVGLSVALYETPFVEANFTNLDNDKIAAFRRDVEQAIAKRPVRDRNEARDVVSYVTRLAQMQLGIRPAAVILEYTSPHWAGSMNTLRF